MLLLEELFLTRFGEYSFFLGANPVDFAYFLVALLFDETKFAGRLIRRFLPTGLEDLLRNFGSLMLIPTLLIISREIVLNLKTATFTRGLLC